MFFDYAATKPWIPLQDGSAHTALVEPRVRKASVVRHEGRVVCIRDARHGMTRWQRCSSDGGTHL
jgi:hypothetical protein